MSVSANSAPGSLPERVEGQIDEVRRVHLMGDQTQAQQMRLDEAYDDAMEANPGYTPGAWGWGYGGACSVSGVGTGGAAPLPLLPGLGVLVALQRPPAVGPRP